METIRAFWHAEEAVTAIEYGLIAALVAVAVIAGAGALGVGLNDFFQRVANCVNTPTQPVCALVA